MMFIVSYDNIMLLTVVSNKIFFRVIKGLRSNARTNC